MTTPPLSLARPPHRSRQWPKRLLIGALIAGAVLAWRTAPPVFAQNVPTSTPRPSLSVTAVQPRRAALPMRLAANGSVAAWQEAIVGAEIGGLRLAKVNVDVGSVVRKGQVLAEFAREAIEADIAQGRAALAEAEATLADAQANAARARQVADTGALSSQQVAQYQTAATTARARVASARAALDAQRLRLTYTRVVASDDGVISSRTATLGAVVGVGQELFKLIRQGRLEWRGELVADELPKLKVGQAAIVTAHGLAPVTGKIRMIAPTVDPASRNALVYVDLPVTAANGEPNALRAGMFARGEFELGSSTAMTLPQSAITLRDGFSYAFRLGPLDNGVARVTEVRVQPGRRVDGQVEVLSGLGSDDRVVASGASFLADGDVVRVVQQ